MDSAESSARRPTKKRKSDPTASTSAPKRARSAKKGRLAGLLEISLDVVFEIFGNLHPLDVLRLSRTSKEFRNLLMHKSSVSIWRASLINNVPDLPPCAPGMTEPQWVSLVFDATCHVCQKIARKVDWGIFARICNKCAKNHLGTQFLGMESTAMTLFLDMIPTRPDPSRPFVRVFFRGELENIKKKYNAIQDAEAQKKFVEDRKELVKSLQEHTKLCEAWAEGVAENRSTELADLREERFMAISAKLTGLGWGTELDNIPLPDSLRSHKFVKQPHALTERTWRTIKPEMIAYMERMKAKRLAREHAALVLERKAIAGKVLRTFKRSQLPWTEIMPGVPDFWDFPEINAVLQQPLEVQVDEQSFESMIPEFPGMIATWREGLAKQLVLARRRASQDDAAEDNDEIKTRLKLATSVFKCNACGDDDEDPYFDSILFHDDGYGIEMRCRPLYWPRVLSHRCLTKAPDYVMSLMLFGNAGRDVPWRSSLLSMDPRVAGIVEKIVVACGMDPATTTVEDMDVADPRLACHTCAERQPPSDSAPAVDKEAEADTAGAREEVPATARAFSWRHAVRHEGEGHWRRPTAWYMLSDADAAAARAAETEAMAKGRKTKVNTVQDVVDNVMGMTDEAEERADASMEDTAADEADEDGGILPSQLPEGAWSCAHCIDTPHEKPPMTLEGMLNHLAARHDILTPAVLNEDYYRTLAAPEVYTKAHFPAPSLMVSMPPAPPMPAPRPRSNLPWPYDLYDSEDEDFNFFGMDDFW